MEFEVFDRVAAATGGEVVGPAVRVAHNGQLLLNEPVWRFLAEQYGANGPGLDVALLFSTTDRVAGIQPVLGRDVPDTARFRLQVMRGEGYPRGFDARVFVDFWQIPGGEYPAVLHRGPGARVITFEVGRTPAARVAGGSAGDAAGRRPPGASSVRGWPLVSVSAGGGQ